MENERLVQQLEVALHDTKKQAESQREKSLAKVNCLVFVWMG